MTRPENSWPGMIGYGVGGKSPSAICTSVPQMPQMPTWMTSSPCPGAGSGASVTLSCPGFCQTTARITHSFRRSQRAAPRRWRGCSIADPLAGVRIEQVQTRGVDLDLDGLAGARMLAAGPDDDGGAGAAG